MERPTTMSFLNKMRAGQAPAAKVTDPVCHMTFHPERTAGTSLHEGRTVHFCSPGCKARFDAEPGRYPLH